MSFVSDYLEYTKDRESCSAFWKWSAYVSISAILRDQCYLPQGDSKLFPNIYVLELANSSVDRKNPPVELSEELVRAVKNTKIIAGRSSMQGILHELSQAETDSKTGKIQRGNSAIMYAPELSANLVTDPQAVGILTDIYQSRPHYETLLRTQNKTTIKNLVFNMYAASNMDMLSKIFDVTAIRGGLLARTFLITPNEFRRANSLLKPPDPNRGKLKQSLISILRDIASLQGEFVIQFDAAQEYDDWYIPFRDSQRDKRDKTGVVGRIHTSILKLAFILAANDYTLQVRKCHIEQAIIEGMDLLKNYNTLSNTGGKSNLNEAHSLVINDLFIAKGHILSKKQILSKHWDDVDSETLERSLATLVEAGLVTTATGKNGNDYQLSEHVIKNLSGKR